MSIPASLRSEEKIRQQLLSKVLGGNGPVITQDPTEDTVKFGVGDKTYNVNFKKIIMRSQTCIIFDWDDTLLASTCLARYTSKLFYKKATLPQPEADQVKALEKIAYQVLQTAMD